MAIQRMSSTEFGCSLRYRIEYNHPVLCAMCAMCAMQIDNAQCVSVCKYCAVQARLNGAHVWEATDGKAKLGS